MMIYLFLFKQNDPIGLLGLGEEMKRFLEKKKIYIKHDTPLSYFYDTILLESKFRQPQQRSIYMKKEILIFISENYADWEGAYVCSELNKPETDFAIKTLAVSNIAIKSMGGFTVIPDYTVDTLPVHFEMLILIGGTSWLKGINDGVQPVVDLCVDKKIPVAAICDACTFLADKGYLDHIEHSGNSSAYLEQFAPNYKGTKHFVEKQVVSTGKFITANGTSAVEFAKEILKYLGVMQKDDLDSWYQMFKNGFYKE